MNLEELVATLGLDIEADDLDSFQASIIGTTVKIAGLVAAAVAAANAISSMLDSAAETDKTSKFARSVDVAFESLQRLEFAAEQNGIGIGSLRGVLQGLQGAARAAANSLDAGALVAFARLGVSIRGANGELKSADRLLLDIADSVARSGNQGLALELAEQLGLGPDLNLLLRMGSEGINDLGDQAARLGIIMGDDTARESEKFRNSMKKLETAADRLLIAAGLPLLEWLNGLVDSFMRFAESEDGEVVIRRFGIAFSVLGSAMKLLLEPFKAANALFEEFGPIALLVLAPAVPILWSFAGAVLATASPLILTAAAITALLAALNELRVFFESEENDGLISRGLSALGYDPKNVRANAIDAFGLGAEGLQNLVGSLTSGASSLFGYLPGSGAAAPAAAGSAGSVTVNNDIRIDGAQSVGSIVDGIKRLTANDIREAAKSTASRVVK